MDEVLKTEIIVVLLGKRRGVLLGDFAGLFYQTHGYEFQLANYGYKSLKQLLNDMKDLVTLIETPSGWLVRCRSPSQYRNVLVLMESNAPQRDTQDTHSFLSSGTTADGQSVSRNDTASPSTSPAATNKSSSSTKEQNLTQNNHGKATPGPEILSRDNNAGKMDIPKAEGKPLGPGMHNTLCREDTKLKNCSETQASPASATASSNPQNGKNKCPQQLPSNHGAKNMDDFSASPTNNKQQQNRLPLVPNVHPNLQTISNSSRQAKPSPPKPMKSTPSPMTNSRNAKQTPKAPSKPPSYSGQRQDKKTPKGVSNSISIITEKPKPQNQMIARVAPSRLYTNSMSYAACLRNVPGTNQAFQTTPRVVQSPIFNLNCHSQGFQPAQVAQSRSRTQSRSVVPVETVKENLSNILRRHTAGIPISKLQRVYLLRFGKPLSSCGYSSLRHLLVGLTDVAQIQGVGVQTLVFPLSSNIISSVVNKQHDSYLLTHHDKMLPASTTSPMSLRSQEGSIAEEPQNVTAEQTGALVATATDPWALLTSSISHLLVDKKSEQKLPEVESNCNITEKDMITQGQQIVTQLSDKHFSEGSEQTELLNNSFLHNPASENRNSKEVSLVESSNYGIIQHINTQCPAASNDSYLCKAEPAPPLSLSMEQLNDGPPFSHSHQNDPKTLKGLPHFQTPELCELPVCENVSDMSITNLPFSEDQQHRLILHSSGFSVVKHETHHVLTKDNNKQENTTRVTVDKSQEMSHSIVKKKNRRRRARPMAQLKANEVPTDAPESSQPPYNGYNACDKPEKAISPSNKHQSMSQSVSNNKASSTPSEAQGQFMKSCTSNITEETPSSSGLAFQKLLMESRCSDSKIPQQNQLNPVHDRENDTDRKELKTSVLDILPSSQSQQKTPNAHESMMSGQRDLLTSNLQDQVSENDHDFHIDYFHRQTELKYLSPQKETALLEISLQAQTTVYPLPSPKLPGYNATTTERQIKSSPEMNCNVDHSNTNNREKQQKETALLEISLQTQTTVYPLPSPKLPGYNATTTERQTKSSPEMNCNVDHSNTNNREKQHFSFPKIDQKEDNVLANKETGGKQSLLSQIHQTHCTQSLNKQVYDPLNIKANGGNILPSLPANIVKNHWSSEPPNSKIPQTCHDTVNHKAIRKEDFPTSQTDVVEKNLNISDTMGQSVYLCSEPNQQVNELHENTIQRATESHTVHKSQEVSNSIVKKKPRKKKSWLKALKNVNEVPADAPESSGCPPLYNGFNACKINKPETAISVEHQPVSNNKAISTSSEAQDQFMKSCTNNLTEETPLSGSALQMYMETRKIIQQTPFIKLLDFGGGSKQAHDKANGDKDPSCLPASINDSNRDKNQWSSESTKSKTHKTYYNMYVNRSPGETASPILQTNQGKKNLSATDRIGQTVYSCSEPNQQGSRLHGGTVQKVNQSNIVHKSQETKSFVVKEKSPSWQKPDGILTDAPKSSRCPASPHNGLVSKPESTESYSKVPQGASQDLCNHKGINGTSTLPNHVLTEQTEQTSSQMNPMQKDISTWQNPKGPSEKYCSIL
eukprot:XP_012822969.1 PREDICTED: uncharacterized protein LOC100497104 [Xenopus tropicalis]